MHLKWLKRKSIRLTLETKNTASNANKSNLLVYAEDHDVATQAYTLNADSVIKEHFVQMRLKWH